MVNLATRQNRTQRLIHAMQQADFYPHAVHSFTIQPVTTLQTHASHVFLTGPFAYKLKKPVDFGFLDFSTLAKRKFFCSEELRLNRRLAPELYLEVLPISEDENGDFILGGTENIVDYCLKMLQFPQGNLFSELVQHGDFNPDWLDTLAADLARFHALAGPSSSAKRYGKQEVLAQHINASLQEAAKHAGDTLNGTQFRELTKRTQIQFEKNKPLFKERITTGHIRDCHGDLHLGNITRWHGKPLIFDCIEFNEAFRIIDTLNDAAFLIMDCQARGHPELAFRFLSRYLESSGDYSGMPLLSLFLSYRAGVRGKVACLLADDSGIKNDQRRKQLAEATHYFTLAGHYLKKRTARLFIVGGLSGSGKSHLALKGCGAEQAVILRSDAIRKSIASSVTGESLYSKTMTERTYQRMFEIATSLLQADWPVILDATFLRHDFRQQARGIATAAGVDYRILWLDIGVESLSKNITRRASKGIDISDAGLAVLDKQLASYRRPVEDNIHFLKQADCWPGP